MAFRDDKYDEAVELVLQSSTDQPGFDLASAMAAVDSMLIEENDDIDSVLARLR